MENCVFAPKDQMNDLLQSEKYLSGCYNSYLLESATPEVVQCMTGLLSDTHHMQRELFEEMNSRGWYPVTKADDLKVDGAKQKFSAMANK
ncbi:MAG: spore coat protein [Ruminococcaceae bacterium]|nr:spore coat protein [Oscillospiraceae bacterium]